MRIPLAIILDFYFPSVSQNNFLPEIYFILFEKKVFESNLFQFLLGISRAKSSLRRKNKYLFDLFVRT